MFPKSESDPLSILNQWPSSPVEEGDVDVIRGDVVDEALERDGEGEVGAAEEGGVAGDVLAEVPEDSFGGAGAGDLRVG
ncbi:hypothetical protein SASPL_101508 [Salvia splendens]|uniref:Uncharacterized protein n=1 Tax=Salvia splendens TaxID=180675 RepID=A0A8X9ABA0_SALSN|nr:hypothetical protein SASPL_101508 [Salvia splendens]